MKGIIYNVNERIGNKSTHKSNILSKIIIFGKSQFTGNDQTYVCCEQKPTETPRSLKYTKCLLLHLLIFCVLCAVYDTSLPQTSWQIFLFIYFLIPSNTSICILNMSKKWLLSLLLSLCLADKQGMSVYVTKTKYTSLQIPPCSVCYKVLEDKWVLQIARIGRCQF